MKKLFFLIEIILVASVLSMASAATAAGDLKHNEDIQYIREWKRNAKAAELAGRLDLNAEQVQQLRDFRQAADRVKAEMEPKIENAKTALTSAAAAVRKQLEAGEELTSAQENQLRDLRRELGHLRREQRLKMQLALNGIETVLDEPQKESLKMYMRETMQARRAERQRFREAQPRLRENRDRVRKDRMRADRARNRVAGRAKRAAVMLILSDGFLGTYP